MKLLKNKSMSENFEKFRDAKLKQAILYDSSKEIEKQNFTHRTESADLKKKSKHLENQHSLINIRTIPNNENAVNLSKNLRRQKTASFIDPLLIENQKIQQKYKEYIRLNNEKLNKTETKNEVFLTAKDIYNNYKTLILKIKKTISTGDRIIHLEEQKSKKIIILEGETVYCIINSNKKPSPFVISVENLEGLYEIYVSEKYEKPLKSKCECLFKPEETVETSKSNFNFYSKFRTFQEQAIFLGIHAFTHVVIKLECKFLQPKINSKKFSKNSSHSMLTKIESQIALLCKNPSMLQNLQSEVSIFICFIFYRRNK